MPLMAGPLLEDIRWSEPTLPEHPLDAALEATVRAVFGGNVTIPFRYLGRVPWVAETIRDAFQPSWAELSPRLTSIGIFVVSQENSCRYCYGYARAALRIYGFGDAFITRVERDAELAEDDPRERAFIRFCRVLARSNPRPAHAERAELLAAGFSPLAVAETAYMVASYCQSNRVATLLAIPPEAELEAASLVERLWESLRRALTNGACAVPTVPDAPYSFMAKLLDGSPRARILRAHLHGAFTSPHLPLRSKLLIFAVVARTLGCQGSCAEAGRALADAGIEPRELERILATLTSPRLDAVEVGLLHWARDTVRYEPLEIQRQTRELRAELGDERLLEAVGTAALANGVVRLAMLGQ